MKLRGDELRRFQKKFPKDQVITKEQLGMYLTTVACKPHIVSKGKNWVMKEFGNDISKEYRGNNDSFNEFYFKKESAQRLFSGLLITTLKVIRTAKNVRRAFGTKWAAISSILYPIRLQRSSARFRMDIR